MAGLGTTVALIKSMGKPDPTVIEQSVSDWLDDHPEATTTVQDGSITKAKLDTNLQETVDDVSDLKNQIGNVYDLSDVNIGKVWTLDSNANATTVIVPIELTQYMVYAPRISAFSSIVFFVKTSRSAQSYVKRIPIVEEISEIDLSDATGATVIAIQFSKTGGVTREMVTNALAISKIGTSAVYSALIPQIPVAELAEDCKDAIDKNIIPFNNQINLYNGKDFVFGGWSGSSFALDTAHQKKTAVIKCEKNRQYWIVRNVASDSLGRIGTATEYPKEGTTITQLADIGGALSYSVTTGNNAEYLLVYYTYTGVNEFIQITDFQATSLIQNTYPVLPDSVYTKKQVNDLISDISQAKKCKFSKTGNSMSIYMPSPKSSKYMRFVYELHTDNTINMNQWKVMDMNVCNSDLTVLFNLYSGTANNTEWDGVVRETGTADFIGGYHGDETNVFISVMVDGVEINMSNDYAVMDCSDILIVNKSTVNRCNTPGTNLFTRYKVSHWTPEKYTIENRWIALQSVSLDRVYMTMMSLPIQNDDKYIATYGRYNDGYVIQPSVGDAVSGSCLYNSKYATNVEMWGADFYARCTGKMDDSAIHIVYCDRSQSNIFKGYWWQYVVSGGQTFAANDELHGFSEYEFMF